MVKIGNKVIGDEHPCFIIAEIGINHNGCIETAKKMIESAIDSGVDAVKFQKRTIDVVYSPEELDKPRESTFGTTNRDQKMGLEFEKTEYDEIDRFCKEKGIIWFASCWDESSVDFIMQYDPPCFKIASASLTDRGLLEYHKKTGKPLLISTGMSTMDQIHTAVEILGQENLVILHCNSTYPSQNCDLDLSVIATFKSTFTCPIGYSGHEVGLATTTAAATLG
ncbi:MAG: N-acetylneuraminate synthase family protein, partial [Candidatus Lindowbacteria bacterium]|nr:N-acetylneuraminate synthase family protein [Candidatus Lindowbacteria bacterium]